MVPSSPGTLLSQVSSAQGVNELLLQQAPKHQLGKQKPWLREIPGFSTPSPPCRPNPAGELLSVSGGRGRDDTRSPPRLLQGAEGDRNSTDRGHCTAEGAAICTCSASGTSLSESSLCPRALAHVVLELLPSTSPGPCNQAPPALVHVWGGAYPLSLHLQYWGQQHATHGALG